MRTRNRNGGALFICVLFIALTASLLLNAAFIIGYKPVESLFNSGSSDETVQVEPPTDAGGGLSAMKAAAGLLGLKVGEGMSSDDILAEIEKAKKPGFAGEVLTSEHLKDVDAMLGKDVGTTVRDAQKFLLSVKGKKIIVIE